MVIENKLFNILAKKYNTLDYSPRLVELLRSVYPSMDFEDYSKYDLHRLLNDTLFENYNGEEILKYKLSQKYFNRKDIVAAFEIRVNNSRADFLTINGHTRSYEIKSELDNLSKFSKQAADYMLAFEYNYLIIDERHTEKARELMPQSFGLWTYKNGNYKREKGAKLNEAMNPEVQLKLLTKKERAFNFLNTGGNIKEILDSYDALQINHHFKTILKSRYKNRWEFLVRNNENILPIDTQFFFNTNVKPDYIYCS
jgi:hypothetical protein